MKTMTISGALHEAANHKENLKKFSVPLEFASATKHLAGWVEAQGRDIDCLVFDTCSDWCEYAIGEYNFLLVSVLRAISLEGSAPSDTVSTIKDTWRGFIAANSSPTTAITDSRVSYLSGLIKEEQNILKQEEEEIKCRERFCEDIYKQLKRRRAEHHERKVLLVKLKREFFLATGKEFSDE